MPTPAPTIIDPRAPAAHARLEAGITLAGRYRIVTHLGKGGMGEVYRADDLTLGVSVALKFLPPDLALDPVRLDALRAEVRTARQISHAAICRVFDIAEAPEAGGRHFITMEYVDGEDLASLLRRIGRLPPDKAVEIARQLCFGLAAAHDAAGGGIIHRDLKPANIMIDGRGNARIMDFGIAAPAGSQGRAGTPGYMSPEQFAGGQVTARSDLYSLGLVLYELFTGKPALDDAAVAELARTAPSSGAPPTGTRPLTRPSQVMRDLDPAVERVILWCTEPDPASRPPSAIAVAAALPGGDPLAAALAAGQTPSPELVAMSGQTAGMSPRAAAAVLALFLIGLTLLTISHSRSSPLRGAAPELSTEVLNARAKETLASLGFKAYPSFASGFTLRSAQDATPDRPAVPAAMAFWFRTARGPMIPQVWWTPSVSQDDPPHTRWGSISLITDGRGRLRQFSRIPPTADEAEPPAPYSEAALFAAMGLDRAAFHETTPTLTPTVASDRRFAWEGPLPGDTPTQVRVEAAAERGRLVSLATVYPWTDTRPAGAASAASAADRAREALAVSSAVLQIGLIVSGALLARRNFRLNRADRRGAFRLAMAVLCTHLVISLLAGPRLPYNFITLFGTPLVRATYFAAIWWLFYTALEPTLRRFRPHAIISWSRLLGGRFRDPLVGRDILVGSLAGLAVLASDPLDALLGALTSQSVPRGAIPSLDSLRGPGFAIAGFLQSVYGVMAITLLLTLGHVVLRLIFRRDSVATVAVFINLLLILLTGSTLTPIGMFIIPPLIALALTAVLSRLGVLAFAAALATTISLVRAPFTTDLSAWYAPAFLIPLIALVAAVLWSFRAALAGRPLLPASLLDH